MTQRITLAFTGASGAPYGLRLLQCLLDADCEVFVLLSKAARVVIGTETELKLPAGTGQAEQALREWVKTDKGRLVVCGLISTYNAAGEGPGPYMFRNIIMRRLTVRGFVILDHMDLFPEVLADLATWLRDGRLKMPVHMVDGLENAPEALNLLYTSGNTGKLLVRLD